MKPSEQQCESCNHLGLEWFINRPEVNHFLMRCPKCDLYQKGVLETAVIYEDEYHEEYSQRLQSKTKTATIRLGAAKRYLEANQPRVLDIGCSVGATVTAAKALGWKATGVDVSESAVNYCRENGLDCYKLDSSDLPFNDNTFDLVTHWHVIEHVEDVAESLKEWRRVLKPGGIMMFETPDSSYRKAKWMGPKYEKFWPSAHLYTFNEKNLTTILEKSGFEILPCRLTGGFKALPFQLNAYAVLYRSYRKFCRSIKMCKSLEMICRKPAETSQASVPASKAA